MRFVVVTIDYFTKWVEAEALAMIMANNITQFLWKVVVCKFDIPRSIILDNGRWLDSNHYCDWYKELESSSSILPRVTHRPIDKLK